MALRQRTLESQQHIKKYRNVDKTPNLKMNCEILKGAGMLLISTEFCVKQAAVRVKI